MQIAAAILTDTELRQVQAFDRVLAVVTSIPCRGCNDADPLPGGRLCAACQEYEDDQRSLCEQDETPEMDCHGVEGP